MCVSVCLSVPHRELQRPGQVQDMDEAPLQGLRGLPGGAHGPRLLPGEGRSLWVIPNISVWEGRLGCNTALML